jgi:hypothetical protein
MYQEEQEALRIRVEIWSVLTNSPSTNHLTEIVNADWPDDLYSKSKLVEGSIFSPVNDRDVIEEKPIIKAVISRQPHMEKPRFGGLRTKTQGEQLWQIS